MIKIMEKICVDAETFKGYMSILEEHYRCGVKNNVSEGLVKIRRLGYWDALKGCSAQELQDGVVTAISTCKFLPAARELKELCYGGKSDELRAFEENSKAAKIAGYLPGRDDSEELKLNVENWNLIAVARKYGIPKEQILDCVQNKKSLREVILLNNQIQINPEDYQGIVGSDWKEKRAATIDDYKAIAQATLLSWKEEGAS